MIEKRASTQRSLPRHHDDSLERKEEGTFLRRPTERMVIHTSRKKTKKEKIKTTESGPGVWITTMSSCSGVGRVARSFLRAEVLWKSQNNRECVCSNVCEWGAWRHVAGSLYVFSCMCVLSCMSICDTSSAAGPHSPSGMWDFQVQNRPQCGRRAGTNSRERGRRRRGERGRRTEHKMCMFTATSAEFSFSSERCVHSTHLSRRVGKFLWFTDMGGVTV